MYIPYLNGEIYDTETYMDSEGIETVKLDASAVFDNPENYSDLWEFLPDVAVSIDEELGAMFVLTLGDSTFADLASGIPEILILQIFDK